MISARLLPAALVEAELLTGDDPKIENSFERPDALCSRAYEGARVKDGTVIAELPPLSVVAMTFRLS